MTNIIYECGICGGYHEKGFNGDCREDDNRYIGPEDYAKRRGLSIYNVEVWDMEDC